jgi:prepilin-type N-terminal cleavage/methylation domain-containing protein
MTTIFSEREALESEEIMIETPKKKTSLRKRLRSMNARRLAQEGMTLVEIMVVVIIMALIATAVGVAVLPKIKEARIKTARTDESTVKAAAEMWIADHNGQCRPCSSSSMMESSTAQRRLKTRGITTTPSSASPTRSALRPADRMARPGLKTT